MRIAFSGSGLLFPAHFGAFTALRDLVREPLTAVAGTSGGALIAAALACHRVSDVNAMLYDIDLNNAFTFNPTALFKRGLCFGKHVQHELDYVFGDMTFRDINIPLYVTSSDVVEGIPFIFSEETTPDTLITTALRASIAVPLVFTPVEYDGKLLVDGAVHLPTPITCFPTSDETTIGIRLKGKQNPSYKGLNFYTKILSMALSAIDNAHVDLDELDENLDLYFLDLDYSVSDVVETNQLINEGFYVMREQFLNRLNF
jgi:predicted acylesterase/phospholipase RssA